MEVLGSFKYRPPMTINTWISIWYCIEEAYSQHELHKLIL